MDDVLTDVRRITDVCDVPLLVDIDTGFGPSAFNIARTVKSLIKFGAAACHIEDQVGAKRCGHRPGKEIVSTEEMADRVKAAADARTDSDFYLIARTDAIASHGVDAAIERALACVEAGADAIFAEAAYDLPTYDRFVKAVKVPVLANITEFGKTPLFSVEELKSVGVGMVLYPLSAFRAHEQGRRAVYTAIRRDGHQKRGRPDADARRGCTTASAITNSNRSWTPCSRRTRASPALRRRRGGDPPRPPVLRPSRKARRVET